MQSPIVNASSRSVVTAAAILFALSNLALGYPEYFEDRHAANGTDCNAKPSSNIQYGSHGAPIWDRPGVGFTVQQWGKSLLKSSGFNAGERYNISVYFDQPRHALAYSSSGTLAYSDQPTPTNRACPNRLPFGPAAGFQPQQSFSFEIQVPTNASSIDVTVLSTPSPVSNFLVGRLTMAVVASQQEKQSSTAGAPAAAALAAAAAAPSSPQTVPATTPALSQSAAASSHLPPAATSGAGIKQQSPPLPAAAPAASPKAATPPPSSPAAVSAGAAKQQSLSPATAQPSASPTAAVAAAPSSAAPSMASTPPVASSSFTAAAAASASSPLPPASASNPSAPAATKA